MAALVSFALLAPAVAWAQESVKTFDQLSTRLRVGDTVWVTDHQGHETKGTLRDITAQALVVDSHGARTLAASEIRQVRVRQHDSLVNGTLIGLLVGLGAGLWFDEACREGGDLCGGRYGARTAVGAVMGTGIGLAVDAARRGRRMVVYGAPGAEASAHVMVVPFVTPARKGLAVSANF